MASSSSQFMGSSLASKTQPHIGRSITPTKGRATTSPSALVPLKYRCSNAPWISPGSPKSGKADFQKAKENVLVTIRFRPLSTREIQRGDEVAWYADGDNIVQSEYNQATMYVFDRVFGPATTTRGVYDAAARHVVHGAMEGVNGTVFAYGVTSSGKTHTMHGDQKSPGIIPQAVKDVFSFIQDTPGREFLLRVSYLEIYNEVINDLLDPTSQNLRIREDSQGTYVDGIKEEVILSPAHVLSLIAAGEEHRHVGSNNFNLLSSRSHTIFTLTIESSPCNTDYDDEEIALSQLNLIDLAGSESSRAETTGLRRKEGSYINKSLLTLGTVIAKLSDGKASHIPYRDSKLTRLLQSSLSGHGRVSLICTITPASGNTEETHNTLKFAQRAKRVEIHASANKILDEKSLIKKYQREIVNLKQELDLLRRGILDKPYLVGTSQEDLLMLRQQLEAGQVKMQSRLEEEEQAKEALLGRIQRLTKLILVSTKSSLPEALPERPTYRRRHSFGEEELICLPDKRDAITFNDDGNLVFMGQDSAFSADMKGDSITAVGVKDLKKTKRRGMLAWFNHRKNESFHNSPIVSLDVENSSNGSPGSTISAASQLEFAVELDGGHWKSSCARSDKLIPMADSFPESTQAGELFSVTVRGCRPSHTGETMADQMDLLREQVKMLADEAAFCTSSLKRMSEQSASNPDDELLQVQIHKTKAEIQHKKQQIQVLEQRIIGTGEAALNKASKFEMSQTISKLTSQLNEKAFELEIKTADNRILQEQLLAKNSENSELHKAIASLELSLAEEKKSVSDKRAGDHQQCFCKGNIFLQDTKDNGSQLNPCYISGVSEAERTIEAGELEDESCSSNGCSRNFVAVSDLSSQILMQAAEIEKLKQEKVHLEEEKGGLQIQSQKLAEEASYAKELASTAASELKKLAEEVTKLSFQNAKLATDLATAQELVVARVSEKSATSNGYHSFSDGRDIQTEGEEGQVGRTTLNGCHEMESDLYDDINAWKLDSEDLKTGFHVRKEGPLLEAVLADKEQVEAELRKKLEEAKRREADLENDLAGMWVRVAKLKKNRETFNELAMQQPIHGSNVNNNLKILSENDVDQVKMMQPVEGNEFLDEIRSDLEAERQKSAELQILICQLKSEELDGLDLAALEDLQSLHIKALTKLCQAKARMQERIEKERERGLVGSIDLHDDERNGHVCKVCFEAPTAAVLLPCRHFCLCKPCAVACTECPLCRSGIADRIITFTS